MSFFGLNKEFIVIFNFIDKIFDQFLFKFSLAKRAIINSSELALKNLSCLRPDAFGRAEL